MSDEGWEVAGKKPQTRRGVSASVGIKGDDHMHARGKRTLPKAGRGGAPTATANEGPRKTNRAVGRHEESANPPNPPNPRKEVKMPICSMPTPSVPAADPADEVALVTQQLEEVTIEPVPAPAPPKVKAWSLGSRPSIQGEEASADASADASPDAAQKTIQQLLVPAVDFRVLCQSFVNQHASEAMEMLQLRGLVNSGCACFRNCILQILLTLPPFARLLTHLSREVDLDLDLAAFPSWRELLALHGVYHHQPAAPPAGSFARSAVSADLYLHDLFAGFQHLVGPSTAAATEATATRRRNAAVTANKGSQQDAMEFLTYLLDVLHEQVCWSTSADAQPIAISSPTSLVDDDTAAPEDDDWQTVSKRDRVKGFKVEIDEESLSRNAQASPRSPIAAIFHGCLRSEVLYRSKKLCSVTFQRFHALTLHIRDPELDTPLALEEALREHFQLEMIDEGVTQKLVRLEILPQVLVLQLARFSFDFQRMAAVKVERPVTYPAVLELAPAFLSTGLQAQLVSDRGPAFRLHGVVLHHGKKATGGHYSTYLLGDVAGVSAGQWHHVNDTKHSVLTQAQALAAESQVYLLFYTRIPQ